MAGPEQMQQFCSNIPCEHLGWRSYRQGSVCGRGYPRRAVELPLLRSCRWGIANWRWGVIASSQSRTRWTSSCAGVESKVEAVPANDPRHRTWPGVCQQQIFFEIQCNFIKMSSRWVGLKIRVCSPSWWKKGGTNFSISRVKLDLWRASSRIFS